MTDCPHQRLDLIDCVESTSHTTGEAAETATHMAGTDEQMTVTSYKNTVVRSLLEHDHADISWLVCESNDGGHKRFESVEDVWDTFDEPTVLGITVAMPVGCLSIKGTPRTNDHHSSVVSVPSDAPDPEDFE